MSPCAIDGCAGSAYSRGWCRKHYVRWQRHGDPNVRKTRDTDRKRMRDVWRGMVRRCHEPGAPSWQSYGARGISVCDRWRTSFDAFLSDLGVVPSGLTLERIDNARGYEPGNVRFATYTEQNNHKGDTRLLSLDGRTQSMTRWAREYGRSPRLIHDRVVKRGWPLSVALETPPLPPAETRRFGASLRTARA